MPKTKTHRIHKGANPSLPVPFKVGREWRFDFRIGGRTGKRYRGTFDTPGEAEENIRLILAGDAKPVTASLPGLVDDYFRWAEKTGAKAPETIRGDRCRMKAFVAWADSAGIRRPADVDYEAFANFQAYFHKHYPFDQDRILKRYKACNPKSTWEKYRQIVVTFYGWLIKRGLARENPGRDPDFRHKLQRQIPPHFEPDQMTAILKYFDDRDKHLPVPYLSIIMRLLAYTGMRWGEMSRLTWADIDLKKRELTIRISKNKTFRVLPIAPALAPWIDHLPRDTKYIIGNHRGGHLYSNSWVLRQLHQAADDLGFERRRLHDLRHTFAITFLLKGGNVIILSRLLGHKSITSTMIYLALTAQELHGSVEAFDY